MTVLQESRTCQYVNSSILKRRSGLHLGRPPFALHCTHSVIPAPLYTPVIPAKAGIWTSIPTPLYTLRHSRSVGHAVIPANTPSFPRTLRHSREGGNLDVHSHSVVHTSPFSLPWTLRHSRKHSVIPANAGIWTSIPTPLYTPSFPRTLPSFPRRRESGRPFPLRCTHFGRPPFRKTMSSLRGRPRRLPPPLPESVSFPTDG